MTIFDDQESSFWLRVARHTKNELWARKCVFQLILDLKVYLFDTAMILTTATLNYAYLIVMQNNFRTEQVNYKRLFCDWTSLWKTVSIVRKIFCVSVTYFDTFISFVLARISIPKVNRIPDRRQPCLTPLSKLNRLLAKPLFIIGNLKSRYNI